MENTPPNPDGNVQQSTYVKISDFHNERDKTPKPRELSVHALFAQMTNHRTAVEKKGGRLWSPIVFDGQRKGANATSVSLLVFDIDDGTSPIEIITWLNGLHAAVASTFKSTEQAWRLRVLVELAEPIPAADYRQVWDNATTFLLRGHVDGSTYDLARMFYLPTHKPDATPFAQILEGGALDWRALPVADTAPPKRLIRGLENIAGLDASDERRRAVGLLRSFADVIRQTPSGERHAVILAKARAAGGLRAYLDYDEIMSSLLDAAEACGEVEQYGEDDVRRTIEDGISYGEDEPWTPAQLGEAPQAKLTRHKGEAPVEDELRRRIAFPEFPLHTLPEIVQGQITASSLPFEEQAAWYLAAIGTAVGGRASVERPGGRVERGNVWLAVVADSGYGKSACRYWAFRPIDDWDAQQDAVFKAALKAYQAIPPQQRHTAQFPKQTRVSRNEFTVMGVLRVLQDTHSLGLPLGELDQVLADIDPTQPEGRRNATRMIHWWDGEPISLLRVGTAKGGRAEVDALIDKPTVVIVGNVQPDLVEKLGGVERGLRARWLSFVPVREPLDVLADPDLATAGEYRKLILTLLRRREAERLWVPNKEAAARLRELEKAWLQRARETHDLVLETSLRKAGMHVLRVAMFLAEANSADLRTTRPALVVEHVEHAAEIIEYTLQVCEALDAKPVEALTFQQQLLHDQAMRVITRIERHGEPAPAPDEGFLYVPEVTIWRNQWANIATAGHAKLVVDTIVAENKGKRGKLASVTNKQSIVLIPARNEPAGFSRARATPSGPQNYPQDSPKDPQDSPKDPQDSPENPQDSPQNPQDSPQNGNLAGASEPGYLRSDRTISRVRTRAGKPEISGSRARAGACAHPQAPIVYRLLQGEPLGEAIKALTGPMLGMDTETTGLNPGVAKVRLIQLTNGRTAVLIDCFAYTDAELRDALGELLESPAGPTLVLQNAGFDVSFLAQLGLVVNGDRVLDTHTSAQLLYAAGDFPDVSLGALSSTLLDITLDKSFQTSAWDGDLSQEQCEYAALDAYVTLLLGMDFKQQLDAVRAKRSVVELEKQFQKPVYWLTSAGLPVDRTIAEQAIADQLEVRQGYLTQLGEIAAADLVFTQLQDTLHVEKVEKARAKLKSGKFKNGVGPAREDWNWGSTPRVLRYLRARGVPLTDSTSENAIAAIESEDPLLEPLLKWRSSGSVLVLMENLLESIAPNDRVYASFRAHGASTGRTSGDRPNLQNLPHASGIRSAVRPPPGKLMLRADYSQLQLVIIAHVTGDRTLCELIRSGKDAHTFLAARIHDTTYEDVFENHYDDWRTEAKSIFFGFAFGAKAARYRIEQRKLGNMLSLGQAQAFLSAFYETFRGIKRWHDHTPGWEVAIDIEDANGYGRMRRGVKDVTQKLNSPIQMIEANGFKTAMRRLYDTRHEVPSVELVSMIHDEVMALCDPVDGRAAALWLPREMKAGMEPFVGDLPIKVEAKFVRSYADADKKGYDPYAQSDAAED